MPPKAKPETAAARNARVREEVTSAIERVTTLSKSGQRKEALTLGAETQDLIASLPANQHSGLEDSLTQALNAHPEPEQEEQEETGPGTEITTTDPRTAIPDYDNVVKEAVSRLEVGVNGLMAAGQHATELAEIMLASYEHLRLRRAPDLMANSQAARDFASEMKTATAERITSASPKLKPGEADRRVDSFWTLVKRRLGDLRADMALELDDKPEEFRARFPQAAEEHPDMRPSEALSHFYQLDLIGPTEKDRLRKRVKRLYADIPTLSGRALSKNQEEIREIEARLTPQTKKTAAKPIDYAKVTRKSLEHLDEVTQELNPDTIRTLPDRDKDALVRKLTRNIGHLQAALAAAVNDEEDEEA